MQDMYALSIAGPFGYWLASAKKTAYGIKSIEVRSWLRRSIVPGTIILIHTSGSRGYDDDFQLLGIDLSAAPKCSIIGAVTFQECRVYSDEKMWDADRERHCWLGDADWQTICNGYGTYPVGHILSNPVLFAQPILDVPGDHAYWKPNRKAQIERQKRGFDKAAAILKQLNYKPTIEPSQSQPVQNASKDKQQRTKKPKPDPNRLTVYFGSRSIGFSSKTAVWDIDHPSEELVSKLRKEAEFFQPGDDSIAWLYMTSEEVKAIAR